MRMGFLAQRLFNRPLALLPERADVLAHLLRSGQDEVALLGPRSEESGIDRANSYLIGDICVVPVRGILLAGSGWCWYDATYYDEIRRALAAAMSSERVRAVALHIDSPGGMVAGCFDLADAVFALRGYKPVWAILDEAAFSAAYALASACDRILVPRTGGTGSIGVIDLHVDISAALEQGGVKITTVTYGERKADRYPTSPLSEPALARMQAEVDKTGELFVATVARNRGLDVQAVRDTQAGCFIGVDGVAAGLADEVLSPDQAFLSFMDAIA